MKTDLRIVKTETAIENAFLELVEEKGFENVHLVDIAQRANVNRNTIYLRYGAKEDIIASILDKSFKEQLAKLDKESLMRTRYSKRAIQNMFTTIFTVLQSKIDMYRVVLTDPNLAGYIDLMINEVRKMILQGLKDDKKNKIMIEYIIKGVVGVIQTWIIYDIGSIEENVKIVSDLVVSNVRHLAFK